MFASRKRGDSVTRAWRILAVAALFLALGVFFFLRQDEPELALQNIVPSAKNTPTSPIQAKHYIEGPSPEVFESFVYDPAHPVLVVLGECSDVYYSVLIYASSLDYRESPLDARYNVAKPCNESKTFSEAIALEKFPLRAGESYYVIKADLGMTGQWYNAR